MLRDAQVCAYAPVRDIDRARQFYEGVLEQRQIQDAGGGILYECAGGSRFFVYESEGAGTSKASALFWSVADVEKEVAYLKERGVTFEHYDDIPGMEMRGDVAWSDAGSAAWFKDPDGNILAIIEEV
jgi:catechol 2,3-dioxygenase-like lactoylglutathione lyase family enzyme